MCAYPYQHYTNRGSMPVEDVIQATEEATRVVFKVHHDDIRRLPGKRGILTLSVKNLPVIATTTLPVFIYDGCCTKPLMYDPATQMTASEFQDGHYYLFFYDKCDNIIILMNAEATSAPTTA